MAGNSNIEWTDASWTPIRARNLKTGKLGWHCEHATTGCEFCYAEAMNKRLGTGLPFKPGHRKDIEIFLDEQMLLAPLRWKKPRMIFVCSMTDAFADFVKDEWLDKMFAVMALCPQHTFQVLTKRAERMRAYVSARSDDVRLRLPITGAMNMMGAGDTRPIGYRMWPLPNVWLGVSCERQQEADERIPLLLRTPAAVRFISAEPLLGPLCLNYCNPGDRCVDALNGTTRYGVQTRPNGPLDSSRLEPSAKLDWVIAGGESGPRARPMMIEWVRSIRDQCQASGVAFFFKQWGAHTPDDPAANRTAMRKVGKKAAGRLLDGREHNGMPSVLPSALAGTQNKNHAYRVNAHTYYR